MKNGLILQSFDSDAAAIAKDISLQRSPANCSGLSFADMETNSENSDTFTNVSRICQIAFVCLSKNSRRVILSHPFFR